MNFSTKNKRPRPNAWRELQRELDEREKAEEENAAEFAKMEALKARAAQSDELDPQRLYVFMDILIGRNMGRDPRLTRGRLIFELFDDLMPRTVRQFSDMLEARSEPRYVGSSFSKILPGDYCEAGDRTSRIEGEGSDGRDVCFTRVDQEANWSVPHLNPGVLSLVDGKSSRFHITFRNCEDLDGWHAVFGKTVYGFDVLKAVSEQGNENGEPKLPVVVEDAGVIPRGTHPREFLKAMEVPKEPQDQRKVMRFSSTYRHTDLIGN